MRCLPHRMLHLSFQPPKFLKIEKPNITVKKNYENQNIWEGKQKIIKILMAILTTQNDAFTFLLNPKNFWKSKNRI